VLARDVQTMNNRIKRTALGVLILVALCPPAISDEDESIRWNSAKSKEPTWNLESRPLPAAPSSASDELRELLNSIPQPVVARPPKLNSDDEWKAVIAAADAPIVPIINALAESLDVAIKQQSIGGVNTYSVTPEKVAPEHEGKLFMYVHGGGFILGAGKAGNFEPVILASQMKISVLAIDYRMPPDHPAPAGIDDVISVWKQLLKDRPASSVAFGGSSGGGNLTLASVLRFKELALDLPGALYVSTPMVELGNKGDSRFINVGVDRNLTSYDKAEDAVLLYAGDYDLAHPHISPIYGDFSNFPPSYLVSGTRDLLLSDTVRAHRKLRRAGVDADLHIFEGHSHADWMQLWNTPEGAENYRELSYFISKHLKSASATIQ